MRHCSNAKPLAAIHPFNLSFRSGRAYTTLAVRQSVRSYGVQCAPRCNAQGTNCTLNCPALSSTQRRFLTTNTLQTPANYYQQLDAHYKSRDITGVWSTYQRMKKHNIAVDSTTYQLVISSLCHHEQPQDFGARLIDTYEECVQSGHSLNARAYAGVIRALCNSVNRARDFERRDGFGALAPDERAQLIARNVPVILAAFQRMAVQRLVPDVTTCSRLLHTLSESDQYPQTFAVYEYIATNTNRLTPLGMKAILTACFKANKVDKAIDLYREFVNNLGQASFPATLQSSIEKMCQRFVRGLADAGLYTKAMDYIAQLPVQLNISPKTMHYNSVLSAYAKTGRFDEAESLLARMKAADPSAAIAPDATSYNALLHSCGLYQDYRRAKHFYSEATYQALSIRLSNLVFLAKLAISNRDLPLLTQVLEECTQRELHFKSELIPDIWQYCCYLADQEPSSLGRLAELIVGSFVGRQSLQQNPRGVLLCRELIHTVLSQCPMRPVIHAALYAALEPWAPRLSEHHRTSIRLAYESTRSQLTQVYEHLASTTLWRGYKFMSDQALMAVNDQSRAWLVSLVQDLLSVFPEGVDTLVTEINCRLLPSQARLEVARDGPASATVTWQALEPVQCSPAATDEATMGYDAPPFAWGLQSYSMSAPMCDPDVAHDIPVLEQYYQAMVEARVIPTERAVTTYLWALVRASQLHVAEQVAMAAQAHIPHTQDRVRYEATVLNLLIAVYGKQGKLQEMRESFHRLDALNMSPTFATGGLILRVLPDTPESAQFAIKLLETLERSSSMVSTLFVNSVLRKLVVCRAGHDTFTSVRQLIKRRSIVLDAHSYRLLVLGGLKSEQVSMALQCYMEFRNWIREARASGASPLFKHGVCNWARPYNHLMHYFATKVPDSTRVFRFYADMLDDQVPIDIETYRVLIHAHACIPPYNIERAVELFDQVVRQAAQSKDWPTPGTSIYNSLIQGYGIHNHNAQAATEWFEQLKSSQTIASQHTFQIMRDTFLAANDPAKARRMERILQTLKSKRRPNKATAGA
ncbi:hypothetical protein H4R34_001726 [Dimargaris verticillata]|uniref:Pentacotripeptide-repeat region of PRORP domain-containing protein n=1 Tax=Dimargaris verticillata TaxID=2761393 RepID=A0A9W8EEQ5_9FUNG|nr:hypothetical protein H4R34_001726 [Dimargaris verticillata]